MGTGPRLVIISSSRAHRVSIRALFSDRLHSILNVSVEELKGRLQGRPRKPAETGEKPGTHYIYPENVMCPQILRFLDEM